MDKHQPLMAVIAPWTRYSILEEEAHRKRAKLLVDHVFDQCQFGLRGGGLHWKRTMVLTSSSEVAERLKDYMYDGGHGHELVIGGSKVTEQAGR